MKKTHNRHIAVIGGGPAGLMAAERLAQACVDDRITVYERKATPARKFLMAGRGGLNLTHSEELSVFMTRYGAAAPWLAPLIARFTPDDLRAWCVALGQETFIGSSGRVFPQAMKASPLLRAWRQRLEEQGVSFLAEHDWRGFTADGLLRMHDVRQDRETPVVADAVLLALGGASWPRLGADGSWVDILSAHGVEIRPLQPANAGFRVGWSDYLRTRCAGLPLKPVAVSYEGHRVQGEVMITQGGLEGGAIYALSSVLRDALARQPRIDVMLDLRPNATHAELAEKLSAPRRGASMGNFLRRTLNLSAQTIVVLNEAQRDLALLDAARLAALIKAVPVSLDGIMPLDRAISTAGGVARDELDAGLMLRKLPGVFVAGEMIDWEAPTGGYLLQATFATGVAAAQGMVRYLKGTAQ